MSKTSLTVLVDDPLISQQLGEFLNQIQSGLLQGSASFGMQAPRASLLISSNNVEVERQSVYYIHYFFFWLFQFLIVNLLRYALFQLISLFVCFFFRLLSWKHQVNLCKNTIFPYLQSYLQALYSHTLYFQNGGNKVLIELCFMQFWSEMILVISNRTRAILKSLV